MKSVDADVEVAIVDCASGDQSVERIKSCIDDFNSDGRFQILPLSHNNGFAYANNAAIGLAMNSSSMPDYFWLLNPDTIVKPGALVELLQFLTNHPQVGIVGSRLEGEDGKPQRSAFRFPSLLGELENGTRFRPVSRLLSRWIVAPPVRDEPFCADWVAGASMLVRREVLTEVGLLDDGYFMYYEEVDFCLRARKAAWDCWYVPSSRVVHFVGQSSGVTDLTKPGKPLPKYWFDSRRRYFQKNHGRFYALGVQITWAIAYLTWRLRRRVQRKPNLDPPNLLSDSFRWVFWPLLTGR